MLHVFRSSEFSDQGSDDQLSTFEAPSSLGGLVESSLAVKMFLPTDRHLIQQEEDSFRNLIQEEDSFRHLIQEEDSFRHLIQEEDSFRHLIQEEVSSLSEVQALPALILDTSGSLETLEDLTNDNEDMAWRPIIGQYPGHVISPDQSEEIVWRTSQYYGIDLVSFCIKQRGPLID